MSKETIYIFDEKKKGFSPHEAERGEIDKLDAFTFETRTKKQHFIFTSYATLDDAQAKAVALKNLGFNAYLAAPKGESYGALIAHEQYAMSHRKKIFLINGGALDIIAEKTYLENKTYKISETATYRPKTREIEFGSYIEFKHADREKVEKEALVRMEALKLLGIQGIRAYTIDGNLLIFTPTDQAMVHMAKTFDNYRPVKKSEGESITEKAQILTLKEMPDMGNMPLFRGVRCSKDGGMSVHYFKSYRDKKDDMKLEVAALYHLGVPVSYASIEGEFVVITPELGSSDAFNYLSQMSPEKLPEFKACIPDMVSQLLNLERAGMIAGDIKPENMIVRREPTTGKLKMQIIDPSATYIGSTYRTTGGTPGYMANERLRLRNGGYEAEDLFILAKIEYAIEELALSILALTQEVFLIQAKKEHDETKSLPIHYGFYVETGDARQDTLGATNTMFRPDLAMEPLFNVLARMLRAAFNPSDHYTSFEQVLEDLRAVEAGTYICRPINENFILSEFFQDDGPMSLAKYKAYEAASVARAESMASSTDSAPDVDKKSSVTADENLAVTTKALRSVGFHAEASPPSTPKAPLRPTTAHNTPPRRAAVA